MDSLFKLLLGSVLLLVSFVEETRGYAIVTGTVFCDECKDGQRSLFDYPLSGMKVAVTCGDSNGQIIMQKEETTNWFGGYTVSFDGTPDLSSCYAQLSNTGQGSSSCGASAGPAKKLRLMFRIFNMEMYSVDSLLSQPAQPMSFCPRSSNPPAQGQPKPVTPTPSPPIVKSPPISTPTPSPPIVKSPPISTPTPSPPIFNSPPISTPRPPMPFFGASACPYQSWTMPEHRCHWSLVAPDTKVAVAFGLIAARRYGTDMTLWEGLQGRGNIYRTLLREGTTALLNSYNSIQFRYPTLSVITEMNMALMGTPQQALVMAWRFKRANSGYGNVQCNLTPCKGN